MLLARKRKVLEPKPHPEVSKLVNEALETVDRVIAQARATKEKARSISSTAVQIARASTK
jgi:hypothetical protein